MHQQLLDACARGAAVLLISDDLDEIFALADRIAVIHAGRLTPARPTADWDLAAIGLAMAGAGHRTPTPRQTPRTLPPGGAASALGSRGVTMRLEARGEISRVMLVVAPFAAVAFTLALSALFVAWAGAPIGRTYALIFEGGFGSRFAWSETLTRATPLILTGLVGGGGVPRALLQHRRARASSTRARSPRWRSAACTAARVSPRIRRCSSRR